MAEHIMCITAAGGIPLLSRTKAGCTPLSFPVVGSLYGVQMFGINRDVKLKSMITEDYHVVWKIYDDSIVLIAIEPTPGHGIQHTLMELNTDPALNLQSASHNAASTLPDDHLLRLLDNVFNSLVLLTGLSELQNIQNVDRLKKDLKACYPLVDTFLNVDNSPKRNKNLALFGGLTHCVDIMLNPEAKILEEHLQAFLEASSSEYGCLVFNGKLVCATEKWRLLDGEELALLGILICILPSSVTSCDMPVYLPKVSPNVAHRLLILTLVVGSGGGMRVCVLCGPEPSLAHVQEKLVDRFWGPATNTLQKCCLSSDIPEATRSQLPSELLGFLLIDSESRGCVSHIAPPSIQETTSKRKQRKQVNVYEYGWIYDKLVEFYKFVVGTSLSACELYGSDESIQSSNVGLAHYRCLKQHKCFALVKSKYQLFAVYNSSAPTFALQGLTERIVNILMKDKLI